MKRIFYCLMLSFALAYYVPNSCMYEGQNVISEPSIQGITARIKAIKNHLQNVFDKHPNWTTQEKIDWLLVLRKIEPANYIFKIAVDRALDELSPNY